MNQHNEIWYKVLHFLSEKIKKADFYVWFQGTTILNMDEDKVVIGVPSIFAKDWFQKRYVEVLLEAFELVGNKVSEISFEIDDSLSTDEGDGVDLREMFATNPADKEAGLPAKKKKKKKESTNLMNSSIVEYQTVQSYGSKTLNPKYTLDSFVVGSNNRLAHAAATAVADRPGLAYNPLFIYGDVGLGKTHLLQASGNGILKNFPNSTVVYITAEKFTNEIVESIQKNNVKAFRNKYRKVDCIIIDDIQFLADKSRTQEEFFHTFNELYHENKQIIISSDKPPKELEGLEDRLVSRFEMGMIVDVSFPDYETCLAILIEKSRELDIKIPSDVLEFIALNVQSSIRELEGVLVQVAAFAKLEGEVPSMQTVASTLKKLGKIELVTSKEELTHLPADTIRRHTSGADVIDLVAKYYNLTKYDLVGDRRAREIMVPRQVGMFILRNDFNYSYEKIGSEFGGRNHTTAMHACSKVKKMIKKDQNLQNEINDIKQVIGL